MSDVLRTLKELFPSITQHAIESTFNNCQGNFDSAVDQLLEMASVERQQAPNGNLNGVGASEIVDLSEPGHLNTTPHQNEPDLIFLDSPPPPPPKNRLAYHQEAANSPFEERRPLEVVSLEDCLQAVITIVPDVDPAYVEKTWGENKILHPNISEFILDAILDSKGQYPKSVYVTSTGRKRKIQEVDTKSEDTDYNAPNRDLGSPGMHYYNVCKKILHGDFRQVPVTYINKIFAQSGNFLYPTYQRLANSEENYDLMKSDAYKRLMKPRKEFQQDELERELQKLLPETRKSVQDELDAVRTERRETMLKLKSEQDAILQRQLLEEEAKRTGDMFECQCCFSEELWDQATQCFEGHLFCKECCQRNAESQVGSGKYKLVCMDGSGCQATFSQSEMERVLSEKTLEALHKNEQADVLYQAEIDDLTQCPFCDFAAICPPIEVDKEFRCENPDCMEISCRHCKEKSHIPLSCEEFSKENRQSLRKTVEEAMTEALMRKCKKCGLSYVKESGCNKIVCSRCKTMSCYVCSAIVKDYSHFNDSGRGGRTGNCPLFDNTDERHENDIREAEKAAIAKIQAEYPGIDEDEMRVKLSQAVEQATQKKIAAAGPAAARMVPAPIPPFMPVQIPPFMGPPPAYQAQAPIVLPPAGNIPPDMLAPLANNQMQQPGLHLPPMGHMGNIPPFHPAMPNLLPIIPPPPLEPFPQLGHANIRARIEQARQEVQRQFQQQIQNNNFMNILPPPPMLDPQQQQQQQQQPQQQQQQPQVFQQVNINVAPAMRGNVRIDAVQAVQMNPGRPPAGVPAPLGANMAAIMDVQARARQIHNVVHNSFVRQGGSVVPRPGAANAIHAAANIGFPIPVPPRAGRRMHPPRAHR